MSKTELASYHAQNTGVESMHNKGYTDNLLSPLGACDIARTYDYTGEPNQYYSTFTDFHPQSFELDPRLEDIYKPSDHNPSHDHKISNLSPENFTELFEGLTRMYFILESHATVPSLSSKPQIDRRSVGIQARLTYQKPSSEEACFGGFCSELLDFPELPDDPEDIPSRPVEGPVERYRRVHGIKPLPQAPQLPQTSEEEEDPFPIWVKASKAAKIVPELKWGWMAPNSRSNKLRFCDLWNPSTYSEFYNKYCILKSFSPLEPFFTCGDLMWM